MLDLAVANYEDLFRSAIAVAPVIAVSAPLPTIDDGQDWGEVANLCKGVTATKQMRTDLTMCFNRAVAEICDRLGAEMVWLDSLRPC